MQYFAYNYIFDMEMTYLLIRVFLKGEADDKH